MRSLDVIKLMSVFCQLSGELYHGEKTEAGTAFELKRGAIGAKGLSSEHAKLLIPEEFFK